MLHFHSCIFYLTIVNLQASLTALSLSRDTLKTISDNEVYEEGYFVRKYQTLKQSYYSASSPVGLTRLAQDEMKIYLALSGLKKCTNTTHDNKSLQRVHEYLEDFEATTGLLLTRNQNLQDVESRAAGDLIGSYRMVRRYRNYIQLHLLRAISSNLSSFCSNRNNLTTLDNLRRTGTNKGPFKQDFHLRLFAIIFTQLEQGWKPFDIAHGTVKGIQLGTSLKAVHCVEIGVHAVATRFFPVGIEWLELAVTKVQNGDRTVDLNFTLSLLHKSVSEHDKFWELESPWNLKQVFYKARLNDTNTSNQTREWPSQFDSNGHFVDDQEYNDKSWDVCSGKIRQTEAEKSKLFCWHETEVHPTWKLGPLKAELLARHPLEVLQFHQVLQDSAIEHIKSYHATLLTIPKFRNSNGILKAKLGLFEISNIYTSEMHQLSGRISGLKARTSKMFSVLSYPSGGHLRIHVDRKYEAEFYKEHIATMVYFLEAPDVGGDTVIPATKVLAKPIKGSAILFYNLLKSSRFNQKSKHGSCSVVQGSKWVMSRWMDYDFQTHLQCDADENSLMEYLVNGRSKYNVL